MNPTIETPAPVRRARRAAVLVAALGLTAGAARADLLLDDFSAAAFSSSHASAIFYETTPHAIRGSAAVRYALGGASGASPGSVTIEVMDGVFRFVSTEAGGTGAQVGWFEAVAAGVPPAGMGFPTLHTDFDPLIPPLDLSMIETFEIEIENTGATAGFLELWAYGTPLDGATIDNSATIQVDPGTATTVSILAPTFFAAVDPTAVGAMGLTLTLPTGPGALVIDRVVAKGPNGAAGVFPENGTGVNPAILTSPGAPVLASSWVVHLDCVSIGQGGAGFLFGYTQPLDPTATILGEVLVDPASVLAASALAFPTGGVLGFSVPVPTSPSIVGAEVYFQGGCLAPITLANALVARVGL